MRAPQIAEAGDIQDEMLDAVVQIIINGGFDIV